LSAEEREIVSLVANFVDKDVRPVVRDLEHSNTYPEALIEQMKAMGVYGLGIPEPYGDFGVSTPCYALVAEELALGWMSLAAAFGGHSVVSKLLLRYGTEQQRERYLPSMATGKLRATMALTEPSGGSDLQALRTVARRDGAYWVVNGSKTWISNARRSGLIALLVKTDPTAQPAHTGISILLVEPGDGFAISKDLPKLGYKGVESCELHFDDFRVPVDAVLGGVPGKGFSQMMNGLEIGRIQVASRAVGVAPLPNGVDDRAFFGAEHGSESRLSAAVPGDREAFPGSVGGQRPVDRDGAGGMLLHGDRPAAGVHKAGPRRGRRRSAARGFR